MYFIPMLLFIIMLGTAILGSIYNAVELLVKKIRSGEAKKAIRNKLRKSDKLTKWLYSDEKSLSEQVSEEFCNAQVSFIKTDWRNQNV